MRLLVFIELMVTASLAFSQTFPDRDDFESGIQNWQGEEGSEIAWERKEVQQGQGALRWIVRIDKSDGDRWKDLFRKANTFVTDWRDYDGLEVWCYLDGESKTGFSISLFVGGSVDTDLGRKRIQPHQWVQVRWHFPHWRNDFSRVTWFAFNLDEADWDDDVKVTIVLDDLRLFRQRQLELDPARLLQTLEGYPTLPSTITPKVDISPPFKLTTHSFTSDSKVIFLLNGKPFFLVSIVVGSGLPVAALERLCEEGSVNTITLITGTLDSSTRQLLSWCRRQRLPVIVSYTASDFWEWLKRNPEGCMHLHDGTPVINFPDFANPETVQRFLSSWERFCHDLREWIGNPVIAIDIGSYDLYHVPDGEVHRHFKTPSKPPFVQNLPAGPFVRAAFLNFLKGLGFSPQQLGLSDWNALMLPRHRMEAPTETLWHAWLWYRREYVRSFRRVVAEKVRQWTNLPITCSYDINFALDENWATPPHFADDGIDFLTVYAYKLHPDPMIELPRLWEHLSLRFRQAGKPLVALMEVTSALPSNYTPAAAYLIASLPYVSGFMMMDECEGFEVPSRYHGFVQTVRLITSQKRWNICERPAEVIFLRSTKEVYLTETTTSLLTALGIPFDIAYDDCFVPPGTEVVTEAKGNHILQHLTKLSKFRTNDPKLWDALEHLSAILNAHPTSLAALTLLKEQKAWENELGDSVRWESETLFVRKHNRNKRGVWWKQTIVPPVKIEFALRCDEGKPRVTLMPPDRSSEISVGQDSDGTVGVWAQERWLPVCHAPAAQWHRYQVAIVPVDDKREVFALQLQTADGQQRLFIQILPQRFMTYRLALFWAWDDAVAQLRNLSLIREVSQ